MSRSSPTTSLARLLLKARSGKIPRATGDDAALLRVFLDTGCRLVRGHQPADQRDVDNGLARRSSVVGKGKTIPALAPFGA